MTEKLNFESELKFAQTLHTAQDGHIYCYLNHGQ